MHTQIYTPAYLTEAQVLCTIYFLLARSYNPLLAAKKTVHYMLVKTYFLCNKFHKMYTHKTFAVYKILNS